MEPENNKKLKTSRFLLCKNPMLDDREYILSTRGGDLLIEIVHLPGKNFELKLAKVYEASPSQINAALKDAAKWYIAYLGSINK